jgi:hypothetical protein
MDSFEKIAYGILGLLAAAWLVVLVLGLVAAFPVGLIVLAGLIAVGLLLIKVLKERAANKEDDYYDKHVDQ